MLDLLDNRRKELSKEAEILMTEIAVRKEHLNDTNEELKCVIRILEINNFDLPF